MNEDRKKVLRQLIAMQRRAEADFDPDAALEEKVDEHGCRRWEALDQLEEVKEPITFAKYIGDLY